MKDKIFKLLNHLAYTIFIFMMANCLQLHQWVHITPIIIILFIIVNIFPVWKPLLPQSKRLKRCANGCELLIVFLSSTVLSVVLWLLTIFKSVPDIFLLSGARQWIPHTLIIIAVEAIVFWNGIIRVYLSSEQLGIKIRVIGIICGMIPIANLIALGIIIKTVSKEVDFENRKILLNDSRKSQQICATKYPILMVHGVFFRDFRYLNYWGRIPKELEINGAKIFYGNHQSAAAVSQSGKEIADRIMQIVNETGCDKVNIIAHSKGGLDSRMALTLPGIAEHVASLTTINTPHRGCEFADYLLTKIPEKEQNAVARTYNAALKKLGDPNPDFIAAVTNLTASFCKKFNEEIHDVPGVLYQSVGSKLNQAQGGRFPLNFTYHLCNYFDGANDGLVGEKSFPWGENFEFLTVNGVRGISHGDMIDLNRENIDEFDVREYFVQLVSKLKQQGL